MSGVAWLQALTMHQLVFIIGMDMGVGVGMGMGMGMTLAFSPNPFSPGTLPSSQAGQHPLSIPTSIAEHAC
ncbi:hypothetical protein E4U21_005641 [Claviceps maximensis]|nr:hypothetical protein E4U21_005641 [Claviceps maximensis]